MKPLINKYLKPKYNQTGLVKRITSQDMIARYTVIFREYDDDYCQSKYEKRLYGKFKNALFAAKGWLNSRKKRSVDIYDRKYIEWGPADAEPIHTDDNMRLHY